MEEREQRALNEGVRRKAVEAVGADRALPLPEECRRGPEQGLGRKGDRGQAEPLRESRAGEPGAAGSPRPIKHRGRDGGPGRGCGVGIREVVRVLGAAEGRPPCRQETLPDLGSRSPQAVGHPGGHSCFRTFSSLTARGASSEVSAREGSSHQRGLRGV